MAVNMVLQESFDEDDQVQLILATIVAVKCKGCDLDLPGEPSHAEVVVSNSVNQPQSMFQYLGFYYLYLFRLPLHL